MSTTRKVTVDIGRTIEAWERYQARIGAETRADPALPAPPDDTCDKCGGTVNVGDWPFCPHGPFKPEQLGVIDDTVRWKIENMADVPLYFDSKTKHREEMKRRGLRMRTHHVPRPGSDKAPHTTRWI